MAELSSSARSSMSSATRFDSALEEAPERAALRGDGGRGTSAAASKERAIDRIKRNFYLETQSFRRQIRDAAEETSRAQGKTNELQDEMRRLKRRCAKLERKLQEKDTTIQFLQEQQQVRYPLLIHETMRSLSSAENNQADSGDSIAPLSHSIISDKAHERQDADARLHEYEQQIAELYEENQQEKLKNEMLNECLRDQKHAKNKLMKACKHAKQELQAMKDSGLAQMLVDIEAKCDSLEKKKVQVTHELHAERSLRKKQELEQETLTKQLEDLVEESAKWEDIVVRKDQELQRSRDQICEQQVAMENLKGDLQNADRRMARPAEHRYEDALEEIGTLRRALSVESAKSESVQRRLERVTAENEALRERLAAPRVEGCALVEASGCPAESLETFGYLLTQVRRIKCRLRALNKLVQAYEETESVDISLLDESSWDDEVFASVTSSRSCEGYAASLTDDVLEAARSLLELQQAMEDACARLMGSSCALQ